MATIRDVSKLAGVSVATVSRVINKKGYVSKGTEEAILNAMKMLNYTPSDVARRLAGKKSNTIGLIIPNILNPFFPEVARAAEDAANKLGYSIILCNSDNSRSKEKEYYNMLINKQVDGIMICSYTASPEDIIEVMDKGIPVVAIDREYDNYNIPSITGMNREGGELAAEHLIKCGCKNISYISGPLYIETLKERMLGFNDMLNRYDLNKGMSISANDFSLRAGYEATKEVLKTHKDIDGIFAGNDILAIGCYKAIVDMGYELYKDIKLIGYDGLEANVNYMEISSISQPMYDMGQKAVELLIDKIEKGNDISKKKIRLQCKVVERKSTIGK